MMPLDHFSVIAGIYNKFPQFTPSSTFLDLLSLSPDNFLLDAGGGTGRVANVLKVKVKRVIVADISHAMLSFAAGKGLETVCSKAERLPFTNDTFTRVIIIDALHHVLDQNDTINELWRVLIPGGYLLIAEPDISKYSIKIIAIIEKMLFMRSHFLNGGKITALLDNHFSHIQINREKTDIYICAKKIHDGK